MRGSSLIDTIRSRVRVSIRTKVMLVMGGLLLLALSAYGLLATTLISRDRITYAFDLDQRMADMLSAQVRGSLENLAERLRLYASLMAVATTEAERQLLSDELLDSDPDLVRVALYRQTDAGRPLPIGERLAAERLKPMEITARDLHQLDQDYPLPLDSSGEPSLVVLNRSLAPSAQLLTAVVTGGSNRAAKTASVVAADMTESRLLSLFGRWNLFSACLLDANGQVLAHLEPAQVVGHRSFADKPVVHAALNSSRVKGGALEYNDKSGRPFIGAWAQVGVSRLIVVTEIERARVLETTVRLVHLSVLFGVAVLLTVFLVSLFFARMITNPIRRLQAATAELARGNYRALIDVRATDEIGDLADDFARMAKAIQQGQAQLIQSEKLAAFGQLGAGLTHEIKNPLTAIQGFTQIARTVTDNPQKLREALRVVEKETERCLSIVQKFLNFARQDPGERGRVALNELVARSLTFVSHQLSTANIALHTNLGDAPMVRVAANQIEQVIVNLLLNAQQAIGRHGEVFVTTRRDGDQWGEIEIRDSGPGIAPEVLPHIFEPFYTTKPAGAGTGLGLFVSYGIVRDHGGEIVVQSPVGQGAKFCVRLPAAPTSA
jgi:two-component system NtrC family sensor kinase